MTFAFFPSYPVIIGLCHVRTGSLPYVLIHVPRICAKAILTFIFSLDRFPIIKFTVNQRVSYLHCMTKYMPEVIHQLRPYTGKKNMLLCAVNYMKKYVSSIVGNTIN